MPASIENVQEARQLYGKGLKQMHAHIGEAYSHVRVSGMAEMGLALGLALDLTAKDEHGNPWDSNVEAMRSNSRRLAKSKASVLLIACLARLASKLQRQQVNRGKDENDN